LKSETVPVCGGRHRFCGVDKIIYTTFTSCLWIYLIYDLKLYLCLVRVLRHNQMFH
jgi:hypothetical protein